MKLEILMTENGYEPGRGPGPATFTDADLAMLLGTQQLGALATNKRNGHPHLSTVAYVWNPAARVVRISSTADRAKVRQLAADPRAALYVTRPDFLSFVVAEGEAEVSPVSSVPGDETGRELLAMQPGFERPSDEELFLKHMVEDRRVVIRLAVSRLYGGGIAPAP
jgi:PPOX class probable F420-dependent enzyme